MDSIKHLETSHLIIGVTTVLAVLVAVTMGLFSKNQMPVEGKVRRSLTMFSPPPQLHYH